MIVVGRWYWTTEKARLVPEGDPDAAFLAYPDGTEIPDGEAERVGLLLAPVEKLAPQLQDKMLRTTPRNKTTIVKEVGSNG